MAIGGFRFAAAVLFLSVLAVIFSPASSQAKTKHDVIGKFIYIKGDARVGTLGAAETESVQKGHDVRIGDNIKTRKGENAVVELEDGTRIALFENTIVRISGFLLDDYLHERKMAAVVFKGKISIAVMGLKTMAADHEQEVWTNSLVTVQTTTAVVMAKQAVFSVELDADGVTIVSVGVGEVSSKNINRAVHGEMPIYENQIAKVLKYDPPTVPKDVAPEAMEEIIGTFFAGYGDDSDQEEVIVRGKTKVFNPPAALKSDKEEKGAWQKPAGGEAVPAEMEPSVEAITIGEPDPAGKDVSAEESAGKEDAAPAKTDSGGSSGPADSPLNEVPLDKL